MGFYHEFMPVFFPCFFAFLEKNRWREIEFSSKSINESRENQG